MPALGEEDQGMTKSKRRKKQQVSKETRAQRQLDAGGKSRYATRRRQPWAERHRHHRMPVWACPLCAEQRESLRQRGGRQWAG